MDDDDQLVALVAAGDDRALREMFRRHAPWLAARLRTVLPACDVEDVLQETFLAVWRGARGYQPAGPAGPAGSAGGWLWGIGRRQAALLVRRRGPVPAGLAAVAVAGGAVAAGADPAEIAVSRAELDAALDALGPAGSPEREAWRLLYVEDRPVAEVARLMGVPEGTVKSRAHRVRRLLRAALSGGPGPGAGSAAAGGAR